MSLISAHLEQISISCQGIDSLPFPPPKIFTNALLSNHDITSLIRDTEVHERALFSVPPPQPSQLHSRPASPDGGAKKRRQTVFNVAGGEVTTGPVQGSRGVAGAGGGAGGARRNTAVAAVLGGDLHGQIVRRQGTGAGDVDIEVLLRGAEKLCQVYPLPGALERIPVLRQRYAHQSNTLAYYEARVAEQGQRLDQMNKDHFGGDDEEDDEDGMDVDENDDVAADSGFTEEDLRREEEEARELDRKKKELQERLRAMDKDLGGLLNM